MIAIVGAGLSGLVCALDLTKAGVPFVLLERSRRVGGRVGSIREDGFTFDLGFQVLLDSYPAVSTYLDLPGLGPRYFESGAMMWDAGRTYVVRKPSSPADLATAWQSTLDRGLRWNDKLRLALIAAGLLLRSDEGILENAWNPTADAYLHGFSKEALERFFRPFFGGVLIDNELATSATLLRYYFKKFVTGRTLLPRFGMQAIPEQLLTKVAAEQVRFEAEVSEVRFEHGRARVLRLASGEEIAVEHVVLACPEPVSSRLIGGLARPPHGVSALYFTAPASLYRERLLVLPAGRQRLVRNFVQITNVSPDYAPEGVHLVSATVLKPGVCKEEVALADQEIREVFGLARGALRHLRTVEVPYAVPVQPPRSVFTRLFAKPFPNVWQCGDQVTHASIQGAMESGAAVAEALRRQLL
ncbi:MAG TPA: NAD(P)/FAD-dependent oxidoreductase [Chthoniobacterales bacterium]